MNSIFDSHAHYDSEQFDQDRDTVLSELPSNGVSHVMCVGSDLDSSRRCIQIADRYDYIYASVGVHPHDAKNAPKDMEQQLEDLVVANPKVKALGEMGLDYHYDYSPRNIQQDVFRRQLALAKELDLPVIIHDREAHADTLSFLEEYRPKGIVHCYSGSAEMAQQLLELGLYIGFTGAVTFKNARRAIEALAVIPAERLLVETDCPYMAPVPLRGQRSDSSMIVYTAQVMAQVKGMEVRELLDITCQNAKEIYGIDS